MSATSFHGTVYAFGPFRLEVEERRLSRDGAPVTLRDKAFDLLVVLVESAQRLVTKQELMDRLWPDVVVEESNIPHNVSVVRKVLEGAEGVELETIRRQGYRLVAEVRRIGPSAPPAQRAASSTHEPRDAHGRPLRQEIRFCTSEGVRLAYATIGSGPPMVKAANWLNHLELDFRSPVWRHWLELLGSERTLIRYDARGNGLSSWEAEDISFEGFVRDLENVVDAAGLDRFPLLGISQGAALAVAYAARHPERVSALVLLGGWVRGWRVKGRPRLTEKVSAIITLMEQGWGRPNAAFRQIFTTGFFPEATREQADWFNELQRTTTSPANAVRFMHAMGDIDVSGELSRVRAPTLVLHARGDAMISMKDGIELAAGIAGARFVPLESQNHLLLEDDPAWPRFVEEMRSFLAEVEGRT